MTRGSQDTAFSKLWIGQTISMFGSAFSTFALPTVAVLVLHATPVQVGILAALQTMPFLVLGLFAGVLSDRASRKSVMMLADLVRLIAIALIAVAAARGVLGMPLLYAVSLVAGTASVFFGVAYQSYLPVIVRPDGLTDANIKLELSNSASSIFGNVLAGVIVQTVGVLVAFAVDAFSYFASLVSLWMIDAVEPRYHAAGSSQPGIRREIFAGIRVVIDSPDLRWILFATATTNFGASVVGAVWIIFAYKTLGLSPGPVGLVMGLAQVGFVGALLASRIQKWLGIRSTLIATLLAGSASLACILLAQRGASYIVLFLTSALTAVAIPIYNIGQVAYRQARVPVEMQGRMNATMRTFVLGFAAIGALTGGFLGEKIGLPATIAVGAGVSASAVLWLLPFKERDAALIGDAT